MTDTQRVRPWLELPFWTETVSEGTLQALAEASELRPFDVGEVCIRAGLPVTHVHFISRGVLSVLARNTERRVTLLLGLLEGPAIFGDSEWAADQPARCSCRGETDGMLVRIPVSTFESVVSSNLKLVYALYRDASARHLLANHTAQVNAFYDVPTRIVRLLLDYAHRFGEAKGNDVIVGHRLPQTALAAALGVNRRTIFRALEQLGTEGKIETGDDGWIIRDARKLEGTLPGGLLGVSSRLGEDVATVLDRWEKGGPHEE